jgi:hypothetical protein
MTDRRGDSSPAQRHVGELIDMPPDERVRRLEALWERLMDPDGFNRETLANVETLIDQTGRR